MDQSKKTMRHFYCRDVLWETFEQMANDFDCSIDYLINEAMRFYARSKNYQAGQSSQNLPTQAPPQPPGPGNGGVAVARPRTASIPPPPPGVPNTTPTFGAPSLGRASIPPPPPRPSHATPQPPNPRPSPPDQMTAAGPTLYLVFNNQRIPIDKDQFIIGRGSKSSDLAIKDGNISRKHAAIIRRNGMFYIKDLGSTNGIDYKGMRIDNKRIDEGDVFHICDYELRFTYR
jgi:hypothetical protein